MHILFKNTSTSTFIIPCPAAVRIWGVSLQTELDPDCQTHQMPTQSPLSYLAGCHCPQSTHNLGRKKGENSCVWMEMTLDLSGLPRHESQLNLLTRVDLSCLRKYPSTHICNLLWRHLWFVKSQFFCHQDHVKTSCEVEGWDWQWNCRQTHPRLNTMDDQDLKRDLIFHSIRPTSMEPEIYCFIFCIHSYIHLVAFS